MESRVADTSCGLDRREPTPPLMQYPSQDV